MGYNVPSLWNYIGMEISESNAHRHEDINY